MTQDTGGGGFVDSGEHADATRALVVVVPWVPDQECNPNNHRCSERTKVRHRREGANASAYPMRVAYQEANQRPDGYVLFDGPVTLDVTIRWGYRQRSWDRDNLITALKYVVDRLQSEAIIGNDRDLRYGEIVQERATGQPEMVFRLRRATA